MPLFEEVWPEPTVYEDSGWTPEISLMVNMSLKLSVNGEKIKGGEFKRHIN